MLDLVESRVGRVSVARFQCQGIPGQWPTFSLLPYQLVPYFQYTLESMVRALLVWRSFWMRPGYSGSAYYTAEVLDEERCGESGVTSWRLRFWALLFRSWLRAAQAELAREYDFATVRFAEGFPQILDELHDYFAVLSRGPPASEAGVLLSVRMHSERTGRFVLGVPSQGR